jgi:hypothetical protein
VPQCLLFNPFVWNLNAVDTQYALFVIALAFLNPVLNESPLGMGYVFAQLPYFEMPFILGFTMGLSVSGILTKLLGYPRGVEVAFFLHIGHYIFERHIVRQVKGVDFFPIGFPLNLCSVSS